MPNQCDVRRFIERYCLDSIDKRALLLTAPWGTGKTYYMENDVIPYLNSKKIKVVFVSLYGLPDTPSIAKAIGAEFLKQHHQKARSTAYIGVSIINVLLRQAVQFNFDLNKQKIDETLTDLLKNKDDEKLAIVLDDIERSTINIKELMGFINTLTEKENMRVILIANEKELLPKMETHEPLNELLGRIINPTQQEQQIEKKPEKLVNDYMKIKEKTICDTIVFSPSPTNSVHSILKQRGLDKFISIEKLSAEIEKKCYSSCNLRVLIFAAQKTYEILNLCHVEIDEETLMTIFWGIYYYNPNEQRSSYSHFSFSIQYPTYPLFKTCENYILYQTLDESKLQADIEEFERYQAFDEDTRIDPLVSKLKNWMCYTEQYLISLLEKLSRKLKKKYGIPFHNYETMLASLVLIEYEGIYDISQIIKQMEQNVRGEKKNLKGMTFYPHSNLGNATCQKRYTNLLQTLINASCEYIETAVKYDSGIFKRIIKENIKLTSLDVKQLATTAADATSEELFSLSSYFNQKYYKNQSAKEEIDFIKELKKALELYFSKKSCTDKIITCNRKHLINLMDEIVCNS